MPVRLGIELSPRACRIVELDASHGFGRHGADTRVRSFARLPRAGVETHLKLASFRGRPAAVVAWGLHSEHRQAVVTQGSFHRMRREAVVATRSAGVDTRGMVADMSPVSRRVQGATRRPVVVALARTHDVAAALRSLTDEGVRVRSIVTPALALTSLAKLRRQAPAPGLTEAYVALEETATAIALVRDGALVAACEPAWGYQDERGHTRSREAIASRLADEIERFLDACGARPNAVSQICVCGGLPELRSMTVPLMERLDVEVETLDSLFAIDAARLPEPADEFRDRSAELRLAWAVAAEWPAPINLLRERQRRRTKTVLTQAAVIAGVATGVGLAWQVQQSEWWQSTSPAANPTPVTKRASPASAATISTAARKPPATSRPAAAPGPPATEPLVLQAPKPVAPVVSVVLPPPTKPVAVLPPATKPAVAPVVARPIIQTPPAPPPIARAEASQPRLPPLLPPPSATLKIPALATPRPIANEPLPSPLTRDLQAPPVSPRRPSERRTATREDTPLPFEAALGTILYAPERKLAIIDGHIVQIGDDVRGARVIDITQTTVLLRDAQGRLRQLTLGRQAVGRP